MSETQQTLGDRRQANAASVAEKMLGNAAYAAEQLVTTAADAEKHARHTTMIPVISAALLALISLGGVVWTLSAQSSTVTQTVERMNALSTRDNMTQDALTDIKIHLGKIDTQLDYIVDAVRQQQSQHLPPRP